MGRPRKIKYTELKAAIDSLILDYNQRGVLPTDYLLVERSGVRDTELNELYRKCFDENKGNDKCVQQMQRLIRFRQGVCVKNLTKGKDVEGWRLISGQERWGGKP